VGDGNIATGAIARLQLLPGTGAAFDHGIGYACSRCN
jgi:hypothetical protein